MSTAGTEVMLARLGTIRSHGVSKFSKSGGHFLVAKTTAGATIKGHMDFPVQGAEYKFYGGWKFQKKFNEDAFEFESYEAIVAAGVGGIATYLATHIANVGPSKAKAIVGHFGPDTLGTLKIDPERVKEVPGLPDRVVKSIVEHFQRSQEFDPAAYAALVDLLTTEDHKVPKRIIKALCKTWGSSAPDVIKKRPYSILLPYKRLGWITVDALATSPAIGYASGGLDRHKAAIVEALERIAGEGHTWASRIDVEQIAHELLSGLPRQEAWDGLIAAYIIDVRPDADGSSVSPGSTVALGKYDRAEREIARHIRRLSGGSTGLPFRLSTVGLIGDQVHAAEMVENNAVSLLTGKPGVGKSTVVARIIASCVANDLLSIVVVAPTGKAAKRAAELIGAATDRPIPCTTIHKALGPASNDDDIGTPKEDAKGDRGRDALGFAHGEHEPIEGRLFIIDESSMVDACLMAAFLAAIPTGASLVIVGDPNQLPSVGPGSVLRDLLATPLPRTTLNTILRSDGGGRVVKACHDISEGRLPMPGKSVGLPTDNWVHIELSNLNEIAQKIVDLHEPKKSFPDVMWDFQVVTPQKNTAIGWANLNNLLSAKLNPGGGETIEDEDDARFTPAFRVGDKVIRKKNEAAEMLVPVGPHGSPAFRMNGRDFDIESTTIVNGDLGIVVAIVEGARDDTVIVQFATPDRLVKLPASEPHLQMAYAVTCHSAQGSGFPFVIVPVHMSLCYNPKTGYGMMTREWLYTAMSRTERLLVTVGQYEAIDGAVRHKTIGKRRTRLAGYVREEMPELYVGTPF